jgi:hypothetical protein
MKSLVALVACCLALVAVPAHAVQTTVAQSGPVISDLRLAVISVFVLIVALVIVRCVPRCSSCRGVGTESAE